jgi:plastocyanin
MILTRRRTLELGGGFLAVFLCGRAAPAGDIIDVDMQGDAGGAHVWFDPVGLRVEPGQTVRWTNRDSGNSHTVTAYHPSLFARPSRIPATASPWHSDYLLPKESFSAVFDVEGVYDYYCVPHEHAGMVGRIVVGTPHVGETKTTPDDETLFPLPDVALNGFPPVEEIMERGLVRRRQ